jgi:hypothetical protein
MEIPFFETWPNAIFGAVVVGFFLFFIFNIDDLLVCRSHSHAKTIIAVRNPCYWLLMPGQSTAYYCKDFSKKIQHFSDVDIR